MPKRRTGTDWTGLCRLIESNLSGRPGFPEKVQIEERLEANRDGLCHDNYFFVAAGHDLVLRLAKRFRSLRTPAEARASLPREAATLQCLAGCRLPFSVPKLVCSVQDESGVIIGLIESCLDGIPLSRFEGNIGDRSRLEVIAGVAAGFHRLPPSEFAHLPSHPDSETHVRAELEALPPSLFADWLVAAVARAWMEAHLNQRPATVLHGDLLPQNLLWDFMGTGTISVIDWECARIGDPAYDLAIVTRGARQPLKESGGFDRLLAA